ncbi:MAG: metallophosphoesterase [Thermodesulfobacteriota bacterium]
MSLFIIVFLTIYSLTHAVVFRGILPLLHGHRWAMIALGLWMAAMIVAPILIRLLDGNGHFLPARLLAFVGYSWMGFIFLAFSIFAVLFLLETTRALAAMAFTGLRGFSLHSAPVSWTVLVIALLAAVSAWFEARSIHIEKISLTSEKAGPARKPLRIVQVSDLHLGLMHREATLTRVIDLLAGLRPDMVVATGDIVDAQLDHLNGLSVLWQKLDPPLGKFAVTGNHEVYAGLAQSLAFLRESGFTILHDTGMTIGGVVRLVGVDDDHVRGAQRNETALLRDNTSPLFTLFLKHRPDVPDSADRLFDLQLSGHTHRGQIFPFNLLTGLRFPRQSGLHELPQGGLLYVSRGTGTWGPPMRLFSPPEITLFEIALPPQP